MNAINELLAVVVILGRRGAIPLGAVLEVRHVRNLRLPTCTVRDAVTVQERTELRGRV